MRGTWIAVVALGLAALAGTAIAEERGAPPFRVIAHPDNPISSIDRRYLADVFLKKTTRWPNGDVVQPVDLGPDSAARRRFSQDVIGKSVAVVKSYWQQMIFAGRNVPPPELDTDGEVVKYVLRYPGAVGYVSGGADVSSVKVLTLK
jgi:ABC-type phosphate transport system substrate-binding protein